MQYRRFGHTNLNLSVFSLGTMRYLSRLENARKTIESAIALGIITLKRLRVMVRVSFTWEGMPAIALQSAPLCNRI